VAVGVGLSVRTSIAEYNAGVAITLFKRNVEILADGFERHLLRECKIQVLGEAVIREVAFFEGCSSFEKQAASKRAS
jgi:hypothetical protein